MESLEVLNLNGCSKLKEIEFEGILKSLSELYLGEYDIDYIIITQRMIDTFYLS